MSSEPRPASTGTGHESATVENVPGSLAHEANQLAVRLLRELPERLAHTAGVARRAGELAVAFGDRTDARADAELLVAAAWLHDVGYSAALVDTGFHPVDGAAYLERQGWPCRLVALVAHHSGARFVAAERGLAQVLAHYRLEESEVSDVLTFADQTVGPWGVRMSIDERLDDMLRRHRLDQPAQRAMARRALFIHQVAKRVDTILAAPSPGQR